MSKAKLDWALFEKAAAAVKQAGGASYNPVTGETHGLFAPGFTPPIPDWPDALEPPRGDGLGGDAEAPEESVWPFSDLTPEQLRRVYSRMRKPFGRDRHGEPSPSPGWQEPQDTGFTPSSPLPPPGWGSQPSTAPPVRPRPPVLDPSGWGDSGRSQMFNPQKPLPPGYSGSLNFGK